MRTHTHAITQSVFGETNLRWKERLNFSSRWLLDVSSCLTVSTEDGSVDQNSNTWITWAQIAAITGAKWWSFHSSSQKRRKKWWTKHKLHKLSQTCDRSILNFLLWIRCCRKLWLHDHQRSSYTVNSWDAQTWKSLQFMIEVKLVLLTLMTWTVSWAWLPHPLISQCFTACSWSSITGKGKNFEMEKYTV